MEALPFFLSPLLILQISHEQMSGLLFLREMGKLDEFTTDVTVSSLCTYFVWISEEKVSTSTWTLYLLNLVYLSYSSNYFVSTGSFCLQNAKTSMFQSHSLTWFTPGTFHLPSHWRWIWSGPVRWPFPLPLFLSILTLRQKPGVSLQSSLALGTSSFLKCSPHLMSTTLPFPGSPSASRTAHSRICSTAPTLLSAPKCWHSSRSLLVLFLSVMWSNSLQWLPLLHWHRFRNRQVKSLPYSQTQDPLFPNSLWDICF